MFDGPFTGPEGVIGQIGGLDSDRPIAWIKVSPSAEAELRKARERSGLRALIAVTAGQRPGLCPVNAAFFAEPFGPPVLQLSDEELSDVEKAAAAGATVRIVSVVAREPATGFNLVADVPGRRPDLPPVCVMTPRSGWYFSASERGGGLVCWLETLRACATARLLRTVKFVASSGHELGHLGLHAYLKRNPTLARDAAVWIHFGANIGAARGDVRLTCSGSALESDAIRALTPYSCMSCRCSLHRRWAGKPERSGPQGAGSSRSSGATNGFTIRATNFRTRSICARSRASRGRQPTLQSHWPTGRRTDSTEHEPTGVSSSRKRVNMHRTLTIVAISVVAAVLTASAQKSRGPAAPADKSFTVVEATIPEMRLAMEQGRVTSREIVRQYLDAHRHLRGPAARGDHDQPESAGDADERDRERGGGTGARSAARHPDRAEGQHPHDDHADDGRRAGVRGSRAAVRGDADDEPARRRRDHHRENRADRAGQLGRRRADADARQLQRGRRPGLQPVRSAQGSARGDVRRPSRARHRRIELRRRHRGELLGRQRRDRNVGVDPEPGEPEHAGGDQADSRPHQPLRRDSRSRPIRTPPARWRRR